MGGTPKKDNIVKDMDLDDEDDFFGTGAAESRADKKQMAKQDSNDPLAFLKRAENEKQSAAQRKAMKAS